MRLPGGGGGGRRDDDRDRRSRRGSRRREGEGDIPAAGGGGARQVLLRRRVVVVSAVRGRRAVEGGIPQIGVSLTIAGQRAMTKRTTDRTNNNQQLHVEGG